MRTILLSAMLILLSACASGGGGYYGGDRGYYADRGGCQSCGRVTYIESYYQGERSSGGGAVAGAIIGGVLGNQVGKGNGRKAATVAGAVAGGIAGNEIEKNAREGVRYEIHVAMDSGRTVVLHKRDLNGIYEGARVSVSGNRIRRI